MTTTQEENPDYKLSAISGEMKFDQFSCMGPDFDGDSKPHWDDLNALEFHRRDVMSRVELPFWRILGYWSGTCLKALAMDWLIWVSIIIFVAIRIQARTSNMEPDMVAQLGDTNIDILGGFLSFLLVLFVNQTNARFFSMYLLAKKVAGQIQDAAGLASTQLPPAAAKRLVRYMNAAHVAGYVGLGGPYSKQDFFDHFNSEYKLLNAHEMQRIDAFDMNSGSAAFKELCTWCQRDVGHAKKSGYIDSIEAAELHNRMLEIRAAMDGIYDYRDQPTHFFYIHFLCLLSALYLPLFALDNAFSAGWGEEADITIELVNGVMVLVQSIFVVGLRLLGQTMIDPFGMDVEDLSVITYVTTTLENSRIILTCRQEHNVESAEEATSPRIEPVT